MSFDYHMDAKDMEYLLPQLDNIALGRMDDGVQQVCEPI